MVVKSRVFRQASRTRCDSDLVLKFAINYLESLQNLPNSLKIPEIFAVVK